MKTTANKVPMRSVVLLLGNNDVEKDPVPIQARPE